MSNKAANFLSKLWRMTPFSILSSPGKRQSQAIEQLLKSLLNCLNSFQKSLNGMLDEFRTVPINIPILVKTKNEILKCKGRANKFIKQQAENVTKTISTLSQFRFLLQKSEMAASNQYCQKIHHLIKSKDEGIPSKKLEKIHQHIMGLKYNQKLILKNNAMSSTFQKWLADFSIRSQDFYMKLYSADWVQKSGQTKATDIPFTKIKSEDELKGMMIKPQGEQQEQEVQPMNIKQQRKAKMEQSDKESEMEEQQNDIVSQIYKQLEPLNKLSRKDKN